MLVTLKGQSLLPRLPLSHYLSIIGTFFSYNFVHFVLVLWFGSNDEEALSLMSEITRQIKEGETKQAKEMVFVYGVLPFCLQIENCFLKVQKVQH